MKKITAALMLVLAGFASQAQANTWTISATGTIGAGYDSTGVFGAAGTNLAGKQFTQSITISTEAYQWMTAGVNQNMVSRTNGGPGFTDTVTVDGHSFTITTALASTDSTIYMSDDASKGGPMQRDFVSVKLTGNAANGQSTTDQIYAFTHNPGFVTSIDFMQDLTRQIDASFYMWDSFFTTKGVLGTAQFDASNSNGGHIDSLTITAVPEPMSLALMGLGLGGIALVRRRRGQAGRLN